MRPLGTTIDAGAPPRAGASHRTAMRREVDCIHATCRCCRLADQRAQIEVDRGEPQPPKQLGCRGHRGRAIARPREQRAPDSGSTATVFRSTRWHRTVPRRAARARPLSLSKRVRTSSTSVNPLALDRMAARILDSLMPPAQPPRLSATMYSASTRRLARQSRAVAAREQKPIAEARPPLRKSIGVPVKTRDGETRRKYECDVTIERVSCDSLQLAQSRRSGYLRAGRRASRDPWPSTKIRASRGAEAAAAIGGLNE